MNAGAKTESVQQDERPLLDPQRNLHLQSRPQESNIPIETFPIL